MSKPFEVRRADTLQAVWQAHSGRCALCGGPMPEQRFDVAHATLWKKLRPTIDHIRPRAHGGSDAFDNLQLAHAICNRRKGRTWSDR